MITPEAESTRLLAVTRSKSKMYEFHVPENRHIPVTEAVKNLLSLTIGILGDQSSIDPYPEQKNHLLFSASYFDALNGSRLLSQDSNYLRLLGAIAYYMGGFPGSTHVLINGLQNLNVDSSGIERVIIGILRKENIQLEDIDDSPLREKAQDISNRLNTFLSTGNELDELRNDCADLYDLAIHTGHDRELFLATLLNDLLNKYLSQSVWVTLPEFSGLPKATWASYNQKDGSIKELWPAQMILGQHGVFQGNSAVVQMPTSAGKTKSTELIIRSSILSGRSRISVIIAPFRALCQEIYNSMFDEFLEDANINVSLVSDVMQDDFGLELQDHNHILIFTPEKFDFILRHNPTFSNSVGLIVFDEAHLFDDPSRGPKFELLLSSLKSRLSPESQKILISAVMPNSEEIGEWFIGDACENVIARDLHPTVKSTAFVNWPGANGQLTFRSQDDLNTEEFFVPFILSQQSLELKPRERKEQFFPIKNDTSTISLALGCRLVQSGSVAIFCGRKDTVSSICNKIVDAFDRNVDLPNPVDFSDAEELIRLQNYIHRTLGDLGDYHRASLLGILPHHGSTPQGLRLAVEFALQKEHSKFVICTSTLAQGVNLPIRYLIVTTDRQGQEEIKTRDFHNLIGRAGRAMKYTEGTIIFANDQIVRQAWRMNHTIGLLDPARSESCISRLEYLILDRPEDENEAYRYDWNRNVVENEVRSYLLMILSELNEGEDHTDKVRELAENTLAYFQADDDQRTALLEYFLNAADQILEQEQEISRRSVFAKSVVSLADTQDIFEFLEPRIDQINQVENAEALLNLLWEILFEKGDGFPPKIESEMLLEVCLMWIDGSNFPEIFAFLEGADFSSATTKRVGKPTIDKVVTLCENSIGFTYSLIIGSCLEVLQLFDEFDRDRSVQFRRLQKMIKYGLSSNIQIRLYEMGFTDRNLAVELAEIIADDFTSLEQENMKASITQNIEAINELLSVNYPAYFSKKLDDLLA